MSIRLQVLLPVVWVSVAGCAEVGPSEARLTAELQDAGSYACDPAPPEPVFPPGIDQVGNPAYCPHVTRPAFPYDQGPRVLFDQGHANWGTITSHPRSPAAGTYFALGELLKADGYVVETHDGPFDREVLEPYDILVIVHPLVEEYAVWRDDLGRWTYNRGAFSSESAFRPDEIEAIRAWVEDGGSLLINAEHIPFTGAALDLTLAFGMRLFEEAFGGFAPGGVFAKTTPSHPIFWGRDASERITKVPYVAGGTRIQSSTVPGLFQYPRLSAGLDITAEAYMASFEYALCVELHPPDRPADGPSAECLALRETQEAGSTWFPAAGDVAARATGFGRGRVALFTEFSTFSNQLIHAAGGSLEEYGGLVAGEHDATPLVLNTFRWLAFEI